MPDTPATPATTSLEVPDFEPKVRGYDRRSVDAWAERTRVRFDTQQRLIDDHANQIARLEAQIERSRRELRYWHDRQVFVDAEVDRAREDAERIEREARERSAVIEHDAQERAMKMIDRVCEEANNILEHARAEAQALMSRYDDDIHLSQQKLHQLGEMQTDVVQAMRGAMTRFEQGVSELDLITPSARAVSYVTPIRAPRIESSRSRARIVGTPNDTQDAAPEKVSGNTPTTPLRREAIKTAAASMQKPDLDRLRKDSVTIDASKRVTVDPAVETARRMARESVAIAD